MLHDDTTPFSIASIVARLAEWHMPASSAWMIRYFLQTVAAPGAAARESGIESNVAAKAVTAVAGKRRMGGGSRRCGGRG
jgi:hypothetical protein